jgi:hypothetical protein
MPCPTLRIMVVVSIAGKVAALGVWILLGWRLAAAACFLVPDLLIA